MPQPPQLPHSISLNAHPGASRRATALGLAAVLLLGAGPGQSAPSPGPEVPGEAAQWLGLSESALQAALPDLQRLRRAQAGPRGLRAWWMRPGLGGEPGRSAGGDTYFFAKDQTVVHIEQRWRAEVPRCQAGSGYQSLRERLSQRLGPPSASAGDAAAAQASSAWAAGTYDVRLHLDQGAGRCQLLLVHELHAARDASEL